MKTDQSSRRVDAALRERVKELTCLYGIAQVAARPELSLEEVLRRVVKLLPAAWQYPEIACARVVLDGHAYVTPQFQDGPHRQTANITVEGVRRGLVEVVYRAEMPEVDEGPFLKEERNLIDAVAGHVALIVERREAERDRLGLQDQLRHADRLATIGQLAAGVAHEINEPLGNVLGFAQLARKCPGLPAQACEDIEKIEQACLRARDIIRELLMFARQAPQRRVKTSLNEVVLEGLDLFRSRFAAEGVDLALDLSPSLPIITADSAQINQVLVNLVVNSLQAMPHGGRLTVKTWADAKNAGLTVEDTGVGMTREVSDKVFIPFFTTKEVGAGTGLGLSVVHGIISSHAGTISVQSEPGKGTRFEISLPVAEATDPGKKP